MHKLKFITALAGGAVVAYFKQYSLLYGIVAGAVLLDLITGLCAAVISGEGLSSSRALKGLCKKAVLFVSVAFGTFLDVLMPFSGLDVGGMIFSTVLTVYISITECISVAENIVRCTDGALPDWIVTLLKEAKNKGGKK